ncbi:Hypothetical Protein FCC1311_084132 [Hondaea fermentalgiana]|uniref:Uncharacterized protein n=1 Tax=Hondaea fermentalgiana TaxID=2315210 RepID=A0A2R5GR06_9STRA|nr:Hypothetical Protein FCC1311_084132 [Hondaea fermentalgiana]|eukprot:GBG32188.1 Hypothetical Protein FCC1311_084132 [Hondaea fermentalgiana]
MEKMTAPDVNNNFSFDDGLDDGFDDKSQTRTDQDGQERVSADDESRRHHSADAGCDYKAVRSGRLVQELRELGVQVTFDSQLDCIYGGENGEALIAPIVIGCLLIVGIVAYVIHLIRAYAPPKLSREDAEGIPVADPRVRVDSGSPDHSAATGPVPIAKTVLPEQSPADSLA